MKIVSIPLFYSIFITSIVLIILSTINYLLLQTKYNSIQDSIVSQSQTIFASLKGVIENKNKQALQEVIQSIAQNNRSRSLLETSVIAYPDSYYYNSTSQELLGNSISKSLENLLSNYKKNFVLQQIQTTQGTRYQSIIPVDILVDNQTWFIKNVFDKTFFDTQFNNFRLLLVFSSILIVLFTFIFTYSFCYLLSQKLLALNKQLYDILKYKLPKKLPSFFKEIIQITQLSLEVGKLIKEQKKTILELENELQNPIKTMAKEQNLGKSNYLCVLVKLEYSLLKNTNAKPNLKDFILEIFYLIVKNTQEQRIRLVNFGNYYFFILDAKNFFEISIQSIKNINKKIQTNAAQFQKFGIQDFSCSIAAHFGKISSMNVEQDDIEDSIFYGDSAYMLQNIITKAKAGEILVTQSIIPHLSNKVDYTDVNFTVSFLEEKHKLYLLGKRDKDHNNKKEKALNIATEESNPLSINAMLEETLKQ